MWVLFLGDVVGKPGRKAAGEFLSRVRGYRDVDITIANGENTAAGMGLTEPAVRELFDAGVDVLTGGNHMWDKKEGVPLVRSDERILRPANYPPGVDGRGWGIFRGRSGTPYAVVSLLGRGFLGDCDCPFRWADGDLREARAGILPRRQDLGDRRDAYARADFRRPAAAQGDRLHHRRGDVRPRRVGHRNGRAGSPSAIPPPGARPVRGGLGGAGGIRGVL